jgi:tRNA dimethylallyltransferase
MAYTAINKIFNSEKTPFIVGGTGLYVESIVCGYVLPREETDTLMREKLGKLSVEELRTLLTPEGEAFLNENYSDANNKRRIIRVIEKAAQGCLLNREKAPRYDALQLGIAWSKEKLHQRIDARLESRLKDGMIDEIKGYLDNGGSSERLYSLGLEYRYILLYLTGKFKSIDEFKLELSRAIKRFAKRQMTWFRRDKTINWIDMESDYLGQAHSLVENFLGDSRSA